jgi:hypothetical protein
VAFYLRSGTLVKLAYVMKKRSTYNAFELFRQLFLLPSRWSFNTFCDAQALFKYFSRGQANSFVQFCL